MEDKEIIEKVMKGNTGNENFDALKGMFPELFKAISEDMMKILNIQKNEFIKLIESKEKHGVIILDVQEVNEEMLSRCINPTEEQKKELDKEELEIKKKSWRIENRNEICKELIKELSGGKENEAD